jgi:DMSO/TMAO reductase YedYZ molybdopterin-dependent catalytic subunit
MNKTFAAALTAAVLSITGVGAGCTAPPGATPGGDGELPAVEIREYEGQNLSSINDFRENSIMGPQYVDVAGYVLTVHGLVEKELSHTYEEVTGGYEPHRKVVTLFCVEGWDVTLLWEGVLLSDLFSEAGVLPGANTVIFRSVDGYSTSLPLEYVVENDIILAYKMNQVTLPPERGFPFQLVAESKWGYKWIRWVNEIELSNDPSFKGYWEGYGYSNSGDLDKAIFD